MTDDWSGPYMRVKPCLRAAEDALAKGDLTAGQSHIADAVTALLWAGELIRHRRRTESLGNARIVRLTTSGPKEAA